MRRHPIALVTALVGGALLLPARAQDAPLQIQTPPVFRSEINLIRLDVSVLDRDRRPVRGLTANDFTVTEDGVPQRIASIVEIDAEEQDPIPTARMRYVARDTAANDLADQVGDGRVFAIVLDDFNTPFDDDEIIREARTAARQVIDSLGPSDVAAVVYTMDAGRTQDFTDDRSKLLAAIDRFQPRERMLGYTPPTPRGPGAGGGDMPQRFAPILARSTCLRSQPAVPTLDTTVAHLATVPNRRKSLVFISTGVPLRFSAGGCGGNLTDIMTAAFRSAERGNVNIHVIDQAGQQGYVEYLQHPMRNMQLGGRAMGTDEATRRARMVREFLMDVASQTGGRAIVNTDAIESGIEAIFIEDAAYYLIGYETTNRKLDGKFRRVQVRANVPGSSVRTRSGYYAPNETPARANAGERVPDSNELGLSGMTSPTGVPLRAGAFVIGPAEGGSPSVNVAVVLTVRLPPSAGTLTETLTVTRTVYDAESRAGTPVQEKLALSLPPSPSADRHHHLFYRYALPPGRHQFRLHVGSAVLDRFGTVYADVEVPDYSRPRNLLSDLVLGHAGSEGRTDALASILPVVPTAAREFQPNEALQAFVSLRQGTSTATPVTMKFEVLDVRDATVFETERALTPDAFDDARQAAVTIDVPIAGLRHGPYLLTATAASPGTPPVRRDVLFRVSALGR